MNIFLEMPLLLWNGGTDLTGGNRGNGVKDGSYGRNGNDGKNSNCGAVDVGGTDGAIEGLSGTAKGANPYAIGEKTRATGDEFVGVSQGDFTEGNEKKTGKGTVGGTPTGAGETPALPGSETAAGVFGRVS
jgi:hypothetical protein